MAQLFVEAPLALVITLLVGAAAAGAPLSGAATSTGGAPGAPRAREPVDDGLRLELALDSRPGEAGLIEVRLRNVGSKTWLVNRRFAFANKGNPLAELTFEATPPATVGCRFNLRPPTAADYVLLRPGELIGRTFEVTTLACFAAEHAQAVDVRVTYQTKTTGKHPPGTLPTTDITSNRLTVAGTLVHAAVAPSPAKP